VATTTTIQDDNFRDAVISRSLLEDAIAWIAENMEPEDVFSEKALEAWATRHGMTLDNPDE